MELFYDPEFKGEGRLNEDESKHCINVLRHKSGDIITITNGKGQFYRGTITHNHPKRCEIAHLETINFPDQPYQIHLAVAPTKSIDRFEWLIEKAVELGVSQITPLLCQYSERKKIRTDRIGRIAISAMKQSLKAYLPKMNELTPFDTFIKGIDPKHTYLAHCYDDNKSPLQKAYHSFTPAILCIGPEGDFSMEEVTQAKERGCHMVSLGSSRLRTETAGLLACHTIHLANE